MKILISILGSTGSIGLSSLEIVGRKKKLFECNIFVANKNSKLISYQIRKYKPKYFIINDFKIFNFIQKKFKKSKTKILNNFNRLNKYKKSDITISAIPGIAGLLPTIKMIDKSKKILIANKESVICGWKLLKQNAKKHRTKIIPIDSEHYSIFNLLKNQKLDSIKKIYLTASGGPFLNYKLKQLKKITPKQALRHPKWKMGNKITIDSATLMNKVLEFVEAQKLFSIPNKKLDILIHPESLVHAIIIFKNGLTKLIYHETSMIIPLANAIFDERLDINHFYRSSMKKNFEIRNLTFKRADKKIFPIVRLKNRINEYPSTSIIINAANEILVDHFLQKKIPFLSISKFIMDILDDKNYIKYAIRSPKNIGQITKIDDWARKLTLQKIKL